jgi:hypothetical protein
VTAEPAAEPAPAEPAHRPRIVIEFAGPGSADCTIVPDPDVTPSQLYGAAWLLDAGAREARARQVMGPVLGRLAIPGLEGFSLPPAPGRS